MWHSLLNVSPLISKTLPESHFLILQQQYTHNQHSDILALSYLLYLLEQNAQSNRKILFFGIRQNYAHYLSLSKKLGRSLQYYLNKNENFIYYQCFMHSYCNQLPLADTSPAGYVSPPKNIRVLNKIQNIHQEIEKQTSEGTYIVIDCLGFLEHKPELCYALYQSAVMKGSQQIVLAGSNPSSVTEILASYSDIKVSIQNDVGGYGRIKFQIGNNQASFLWRWIAGKIQVQAYMKV